MSNEYINDNARIDSFLAQWQEDQDFFENGGEIIWE